MKPNIQTIITLKVFCISIDMQGSEAPISFIFWHTDEEEGRFNLGIQEAHVMPSLQRNTTSPLTHTLQQLKCF